MMNNPLQLLGKYMHFVNKTPVLKNALNLYKQGDMASLETLARNVMESQGKDFDSEFKKFMDSMH